jgi:hypothetical protein
MCARRRDNDLRLKDRGGIARAELLRGYGMPDVTIKHGCARIEKGKAYGRDGRRAEAHTVI